MSRRTRFTVVLEATDGVLHTVGGFYRTAGAAAYGADLLAATDVVARVVGVAEQMTSDEFRVRYATTAAERARWPIVGDRHRRPS